MNTGVSWKGRLAAGLLLSGSVCWGSPVPSDSFLNRVQKSLGLDSSAALVTDASLADANVRPQYILIEDIHCLPEAQSAIAHTLLLAHSRWGTTHVFLEGAFSAIELSGYRALARNTAAKDMYARLRDGEWTGAEWVAANLQDDQFTLSGMEDAGLYRQALKASLTVQKAEDQALRELKMLRRHSPPETKADWKRLETVLQLKARPAEMARYQRPLAKLPTGFEQTLSAAEEFYRLADARSEAFVSRMLSVKNPSPVAVVVGGYHTPLMVQALRDKNISFVVITPQVSEVPNGAVYHARLQASANALLTPAHH